MPDGVVLDGARDDPRPAGAAGPRGALDREVARLGAAAREHDLARVRADRRREAVVGVVERLARGASERVVDDGLPNVPPRNGSIASSTSGRTGVVAAWSR